MRRILSFLLPLLCAGTAALAQPRCGFDEVHQQLLGNNTAYQQQVTALNTQWIQKMAATNNQFVTSNSNGVLYEIPVVIHVIHTGLAVGTPYNPNDAQLIGMLDYLNQTYAATYASYPNTSNGGTYFPVKFVLAKRSPTCAATTGIVRVDGSGLANYTSGGITTNTSSTTSAQDAAVKALDVWPNDRYYNIWVVNKIDGMDGTVGTFTAGYAYFPGAPPTVDGTVMLASQAQAGSITLPHEMGHAFSLYHTFEGDGTGATCPPTSPCATTGDLICDTEPHKRSPFNCPSGTNACTGLSYNNVTHNFMDYSNCQDRFTAGQKTRFMDGLLNSRPGLAYSVTGNTLAALPAAASCTITGLTTPVNAANIGPTRVELNDMISNSGGYSQESNQYYVDKTCAYQANVTAGQSYTLSIGTQSNVQKVAVWIDYDNNGQFSAAEQVYTHTGTTFPETHSTTITIPTTATACVPLRMRVISDFINAPTIPTNGCGTLQYGQAEDFSVLISGGTLTLGQAITTGTNPSCAGSALTFTATLSGTATGVSYTWYVNNIAVQTSASNTYSTSTIANGSTVYAVATYTGSCGSGTATSSTTTVTRNSVAASVSISTPTTTICSGTNTTFTATPTNGGTPSYQWKVNGNPVGLNSPSYSSTTLANGNTVTVEMTSSLACATPSPAISNVITMTVNSVPASPGAISGPAAVCQGVQQTYSIAAITGATTYTWTVPAGWTSTPSGNSITVTPNATSGTIIVTAGNTCGTPTGSSLAVTVNSTPAQPSIISGASPVCAGVAQTYSVTNDPAVTTYNWTLPSGWSGASTTSSISTTPTATGGTISVSATNACGTSSVRSLAVTSGTVPPAPGGISGVTAVCNGVSQTYTVPAIATATSYSWTLPSGWTGSSTTNSITVTPTGTGGTISVFASNSCGNGNAVSLAISSTSTPGQPSAISGLTSLCAGTPTTYSVTNNSAVTTYNWTYPAGWSGSSATSSISLTSNGTSGTISVTGTNYCGTSAASTLAVTSAIQPAQPGAISGTVAVCSGVAQTYSVTAVPNATGYNWTLPSGWTGSSTTNSISATPNGTGGTISVTASNAICGASAPRTLTVTSSATPAQPSVISGAVAVCAGVAQTYSVTGNPAVASYTWTLPAGWSGASTTNSISTTPTATGGTISVTATNYCGTSAVRTLAVSSAAIPGAPGTISGNTTVCSGTSQPYGITAVSGATFYTWNQPSSWNGTSTTNNITYVVGTASGTVTVSAGNYCGSSAAQSLAVTVNSAPAQPAAISGPTTVCSGSNQTYSVPAVAGALSYTWTLPGGWTGSSSSNTITVNVGSTGGTLSVYATNNCGNGLPISLGVTNAPILTPAVGINASATTVCAGTPVTFTPVPVNGGGSPVYTWYVNGGQVASGSSYTSNSLANGDNVTVTLLSNALCVQPPTASSAPVQITVNPVVTPAVSIPTAVPSPLCSGTALTLAASPVNGGMAPQYQWYQNNVALPGETGPSLTIIAVTGTNTYRVDLTSNVACATSPTAQSTDKVVTAGQSVMPTILMTVSPGTTVPAGSTAVFTANWSSPGTSPTVVWRRNGTVVSGVTGNVYTGTNIQNGDTVSVTMTNNEGCANPATVSAGVRMNTPLSTGSTSAADKGLRIHPNPTAGRFTIAAEGLGNGAAEDVSVKVYNALGQVVYSAQVSAPGKSWQHEVILPASTANGLYQVRVSGEAFQVSTPIQLSR